MKILEQNRHQVLLYLSTTVSTKSELYTTILALPVFSRDVGHLYHNSDYCVFLTRMKEILFESRFKAMNE